MDGMGMRFLNSDFSALADAFAARIHELKTFTHLRVNDKTLHGGAAELTGLEASIKALEAHVAEVRACIESENTAIPMVEALLKSCHLQSDDIASLAAVLQPALDSRPDVAKDVRPLTKDLTNTGQRDDDRGKKVGRDMEPAPRWHVSVAEFEEVGSYMKGRLTLDKVNASVDEVAAHADAMHRLIATPLNKLSVLDRSKATELLHSIAKREGVQGRHFFLESDLREGNTLKLDKTGKSIMVLLRHLGRVVEVRASLMDQPCLVYVLQSRS